MSNEYFSVDNVLLFCQLCYVSLLPDYRVLCLFFADF